MFDVDVSRTQFSLRCWTGFPFFVFNFCMPRQGRTSVSLDVWGQSQHSGPSLAGMPKRSGHVVRNSWHYQACCWSRHPIYTLPICVGWPALAQGPLCTLSALDIYIRGWEAFFFPLSLFSDCNSVKWNTASVKFMQSVKLYINLLCKYTQNEFLLT